MNLKTPTVLLLAIAFFFGGLASMSAQDDLTIPGVDKEKVTAPDPDAVEEERTFFSGIKEGGWAMWPLGAMSIAIIALAVYLFMDLTKWSNSQDVSLVPWPVKQHANDVSDVTA